MKMNRRSYHTDINRKRLKKLGDCRHNEGTVMKKSKTLFAEVSDSFVAVVYYIFPVFSILSANSFIMWPERDS